MSNEEEEEDKLKQGVEEGHDNIITKKRRGRVKFLCYEFVLVVGIVMIIIRAILWYKVRIAKYFSTDSSEQFKYRHLLHG